MIVSKKRRSIEKYNQIFDQSMLCRFRCNISLGSRKIYIRKISHLDYSNKYLISFVVRYNNLKKQIG